MSSEFSFETQLIHAGEPKPRVGGAVTLPIFQSATYALEEGVAYQDIQYLRLNNTPNQKYLNEKLACLEGAEAALVSASGMATISSTLLAILSAGDHILVQDCLYGGTQAFLNHECKAFGISFDCIDLNRPEQWKSLVKKNTRAIYVETISNPLLQIPDFQAVVKFARENSLISIVDNTFASPVLFSPIRAGFDLSLHSATKYLAGHSDLVAGVVMGSRVLINRVLDRQNRLGGTLDPHVCFLLNRSLKTLALRVRQQSLNALILAEFLEKNESVSKVYYPGLSSHSQHKRAKECFGGYFGGMISFEVRGGLEVAQKVIKKLKLALHAPSLGGVESLITRPAESSHASLSVEERQRMGVSDGLIRLSVGIEGIDDLILDFKNALS